MMELRVHVEVIISRESLVSIGHAESDLHQRKRPERGKDYQDNVHLNLGGSGRGEREEYSSNEEQHDVDRNYARDTQVPYCHPGKYSAGDRQTHRGGREPTKSHGSFPVPVAL
jgi:hypothetical protein